MPLPKHLFLRALTLAIGTALASPCLHAIDNEKCAASTDAKGSPYTLAASFPKLPSLAGIVGMFQAPHSDEHWYVILRDGMILRFKNEVSADSYDTLLDIRKNTETRSEMGLQGFAFHPHYDKSRFVFIHYNNKANNGESTVSRLTMQADNKALDLKSEKVILTQAQPADNHNGGSIVFGPDGYLYIGLGDGGLWNDQLGHGQNTKTWLGTILRIDINTESQPYTIPADNPYRGTPGFRPEIYAWGSRNPWRFSFDTADGTLWLGDVGQDKIEEVHIVNAGDNLGWPLMEGTECFQGKPCKKAGLNIPVAEYFHGDDIADCSVIGGFVYRGSQISALQGHYLYGDFCSGIVRSTYRQGTQWRSKVLLTSGKRITSFAQDHQGEVYVLDYAGDAGGNIFHVQASNKDCAQ